MARVTVSRKRVLVKKARDEDKDDQKTTRKLRKKVAKKLIFATMILQSLPKKRVWNTNALPDSIDAYCRCPFCDTVQTEKDVLAGASDSPFDISTACNRCGERYSTTIVIKLKSQKTRVPWLCPEQTRDQYAHWCDESGKESGDIQGLSEERPDIFWNAFNYAWNAIVLEKNKDETFQLEEEIVAFLQSNESDE